MEKEFVSFEISKEIKELGFNEKCFGYYDKKGELIILSNKFAGELVGHGGVKNELFTWLKENDRTSGELYTLSRSVTAPLHQQLIDWFKTEYNIWVNIDTTLIHFYVSEVLQPPKFQFIIEDLVDRDGDYLFHSADEELFYFDYKEAREQAILKTIKIIKKIKSK